MRALAILLAASIGLLACNADFPDVYVMTSETPVVHSEQPGAMAIAHGIAIAVQASMIHEEIEGSSALPVTELRSDDPATLEVRPASHSYSVPSSPSPNDRSWVLIGNAPGSTIVRLYRDDDEVGAIIVDVIAQVP